LIVNADDFGLSPGVNRGIIEAHERGIVTSASLMVRYEAAREAAAYAREPERLGVGLHLDLGEWEIVDGEWRAIYEVVNLEDERAVREEVTRQVEMFVQIMGRPPTHLDSHQHVHREKGVREIVMEIGKRHGLVVRHSDERVNYCGEFYGQDEQGGPFHEGISVEHLVGVIRRFGCAERLRDEQKCSAQPNLHVIEIACHPGYDDGLRTMYRTERAMEVAALCDPHVRRAVDESGVALIHFGQL
jgi:predicted glycoside hydrolase/deacetylase ChbG (UPF0249 family)